MTEIEHGIPVPAQHRAHGGRWVNTFQKMQPGDSFSISSDLAQNVRMAAVQFVRCQQPTWKFIVRTVWENDAKFARCWRVK